MDEYIDTATFRKRWRDLYEQESLRNRHVAGQYMRFIMELLDEVDRLREQLTREPNTIKDLEDEIRTIKEDIASIHKQFPQKSQRTPVAWGESYDGGKTFNTVSLTKTRFHTFPFYAHPPEPKETNHD